MKITKNFMLSEFLYSRFFNKNVQARVLESYKNNEGRILPNIVRLAIQLQVLRDYLGKPITISVGYRPKWYEIMKGRKGTSQHTLGLAADIYAEGVSTKELKEAIEHLISKGEMLQGGIGFYSEKNFIHYDIGYNGKKRRWGN